MIVLLEYFDQFDSPNAYFAPILPAFCSLLLPTYYSNYFASEINGPLAISYSGKVMLTC